MVDVPDSITINNSEEISTDSRSTGTTPDQASPHSLNGPSTLDPTSYGPGTGHSNSESNLTSQFAGASHRSSNRPNQGGVVHEHSLSQVTSGPRPTSAGSIQVQSELSVQLAHQLETLQENQKSVPQTTSGPQTYPNDAAFREHFPFAVFEDFRPGEDANISKVILALHDYGQDENSLRNFADQHLREPDTLYILLRGVHSTGDAINSFHWADSADSPNGSFIAASRKILDLICGVLIRGSNISPSHIVLFGQGQGGMAALSVAASWNKVEFGGVISIGGPIPDHFSLPLSGQPNIRTPALVIGGELGGVNATAKSRIKSMIMHVDVHLEGDTTDHLPNSVGEITILQEFLEHRLRKTEWMKPSVLTLGM
jgi:predicted esterase